MPKIWYRKAKKAYYLQIDRGRQLRLGKTLAEAEAAYRTWLLDQGESLPKQEQKKLTIAELAQEFLDRAKATKKPKTYEHYTYFLVPFVERFGAVRVTALSILTFEKWLDSHEGWKGCRRNAVVSVLSMLNWAVKKRLIAESPLRGVEVPPKRRRNRIITPHEREQILQAIRDEQFRDFVFAMLDTGCRPSEVATVTAANVVGTTWVFAQHKTADATGQARIVYLSPSMVELTAKLIALYPSGPLFRSTRRKDGIRRPWTTNGIRCRFKRLREKVPALKGITAYTCRHTYATHALTSGLPVPVVSALLGHKSTKMVDEAYNHTDQVTDVLKDAAAKASGTRKPTAGA